MEGFSVDKSTWMAPQSRIFCIATAALLSHGNVYTPKLNAFFIEI